MKYVIEVTEEDINFGTPADQTACALARCIRRRFHLPVSVQPWVHRTRVDISIDGKIHTLQDQVLYNFIGDFDAFEGSTALRSTLKPFSFEFETDIEPGA